MKDYYKRYCKILTLKNDSELIRQYKKCMGLTRPGLKLRMV